MRFVRIEHGEGAADVYTCRDVEVTRTAAGGTLTLIGCQTLMLYRPTAEFESWADGEDMDGQTRTLHVPGDGTVAYVMNGRRKTRTIVRRRDT